MDSQNKETNKQITRRSFIGSIVTLWGAVLSLPFLYGIFKYVYPTQNKFYSYSIRTGGNNPDLKARELTLDNLGENSSAYTKVGDEPVIVIREKGDEILAFDAVCTHLGCIVGYRKFKKDIYCNCHGSTFNLNGQVIDGPAPEPLPKYKATIENGKIIVTNT